MGGTQGRRGAKPLSPHEPEVFGVGGTQGRRDAKVALAEATGQRDVRGCGVCRP